MERDYIAKKSKTKKKNLSIMPKLMIITTTVLIILFIAILFFVSKNNSTKPVEEPKAKTEPPALVLPEQPQERWAYLKELESPSSISNDSSKNHSPKSVQSKYTPLVTSPKTDNTDNKNLAVTQAPALEPISEPESAQPSNRKWILQCGAFKERTNADGLKAKLALAGVISRIIEGKLYLVTVGPFDSKEEANQTVDSLKNNDISTCVVYIKQ